MYQTFIANKAIMINYPEPLGPQGSSFGRRQIWRTQPADGKTEHHP